MATVDVVAPANVEETTAARIVRVAAKTPMYVLLTLVGLLWLAPTLGLFLTSLLSPTDFQEEGWWQVFSTPSALTWSNYDAVFGNETITTALWTTTQIAVGGTVLPILVASLAGYAFAWLDFPGRDWLFVGVIALLVVPLQMALIPIFSLYNSFALFDTTVGLILFHTAFGLPFAIFLLRNFFIGIPRELLEAARIDGATEVQTFFRVVIPQIAVTIVVVLTTIMISVLKVFDIVFVMTGGNYETDVVANRFVTELFNFREFGRAAAIVVALIVATIPVMIYNVRTFCAGEAR